MKRFGSALIFAGAHVDLTARLDARPVAAASNPARIQLRAGGAGLNMAATATALGLPGAITSPIGADGNGAWLRTTLRELAIGDALRILPGSSTGTYLSVVGPDGELVIGAADLDLYEQVNADWLLEAAKPLRKATDAWVLTANLSGPVLRELAARAESRFLAAVTISPAKAPRIAPLLGRLDLLCTNRREAAALLNMPDANTADLAKMLARQGPASGTVSDGANPLFWWCDGQVGQSQPVMSECVVDVHGAGDALAAAVLAGLARGTPLQEAIGPAMSAARLTVESAEPFRMDLDWEILLRQEADRPA